MSSLRDQLRSLPSIVGTPPTPLVPVDRPQDLLVEWLQTAISAGIPEPHAITLSTIDSEGHPDARVLIIKNIDDQGIIDIATSGRSAKGLQLAKNPHVALTWYCSPHARSVRIKGQAVLADAETIAADFSSRGVRAKAIALAGAQSAVTDGERESRIAEKEDVLREDPKLVSDDWQVWRIVPDTIEFWQGAKDRNHRRVRYARKYEGSWAAEELWP